MVFIHGGGQRQSAAHEYNADWLVTRGTPVVYVGINYRLNIFAFMAHRALSAEILRSAPATTRRWTRCRRCAGSATTSPVSAAIPATSRSSASRAARRRCAYCSRHHRRAGSSTRQFHKARLASGSTTHRWPLRRSAEQRPLSSSAARMRIRFPACARCRRPRSSPRAGRADRHGGGATGLGRRSISAADAGSRCGPIQSRPAHAGLQSRRGDVFADPAL